MPRSSPRRDDPERGSAVVEFTFLSLLLMVPVVYFIITVGQLQGGSFAVVGAADQAARVYVAQSDAASGRAVAEQAMQFAHQRLAILALNAAHRIGPVDHHSTDHLLRVGVIGGIDRLLAQRGKGVHIDVGSAAEQAEWRRHSSPPLTLSSDNAAIGLGVEPSPQPMMPCSMSMTAPVVMPDWSDSRYATLLATS